MALLRWYGSPGCFDSGLQVICIVGSGVSHLPLDNIHRFSTGFRSGEFAGQSSTVTPWSLNHVTLLAPSVEQFLMMNVSNAEPHDMLSCFLVFIQIIRKLFL